MTSRGAATRYARALFDIALAEKTDLQQTFQDLRGFAGLMTENEALGRALTNPAIPKARKQAVVEELLARAATLQPAVGKLALLLAERDRLALLPEVAHAFEQRLMDYQKIVRAQLVTATALPDDRVTAIKNGLKRATGSDVTLETRVDPAIIGGAVARIGSTVFDGSVTRQLERMREALTATD
ncbi:MAG TPA: ATP synthase F1 subunit delta [Vicinamibacterales bacterium]|nr:ATP synthase F1 subunit delta [Vicinamibacterales bacterium]